MAVAIEPHKIVYAALPKAACSSVKAALATLDPNVDISLDAVVADNSYIHTVYKTLKFRPIRWAQFGDGWYRFTVVRDPLKRLLSVYTDRVQGRQELKNSRRLKKQSVLSVDPDPDFFFQNLQAYMASVSVIHHHAVGARTYIGDDIKANYDRVYKVSELPELAEKLSDISGQTVTIPKANSSKVSLEFESLNSKTQDHLKEYLAQEYTFLGDCFDSPFT